MAKPLVPTIRGLYADGDMVIILFHAAAPARDGVPYRNAYSWYFQMKDAKIVKAPPSSIREVARIPR
jgi:ketosteroid isomerase-like protein